MTVQKDSLTGFSGVGAGSTAQISLPVNDIYTGFELELSSTMAGGATVANMEAEIGDITLRIDGNAQIQIPFAALNAIQSHYGAEYAAADGIIPIYLNSPWWTDLVDQLATSWGMADVSTFEMTIDIGAGFTAPTLSGRAFTIPDPRGEVPIGDIRRIVRSQINPSGTGDYVMDTLRKDIGDYIAFHHSTADINFHRIKAGGKTIRKTTRTQAGRDAARVGFQQMAGYTQINLCDSGSLSDRLPIGRIGSRSFQVVPDMTVATGHDLWTEVFGPILK